MAVRGPLAWVTCTENILSQVRGRVSVTSVLATNIFEHGDDGWLMIHHHASHVLRLSRAIAGCGKRPSCFVAPSAARSTYRSTPRVRRSAARIWTFLRSPSATDARDASGVAAPEHPDVLVATTR